MGAKPTGGGTIGGPGGVSTTDKAVLAPVAVEAAVVAVRAATMGSNSTAEGAIAGPRLG